jgi:monoamine oxidase
MTMQASVAIVGGGLAGLHAARLLRAAGIDFLLFEARDRLGGRIFSADKDGRPSDDGFDLGPSWFWPETQPALGSLVDELGLAVFPQNSDGDVVFERMSREGPQRYRGFDQAPRSMRLVGGAHALVRALEARLPPERLLRGMRVTRAMLDDNAVALTIVGADSSERRVLAGYVIFALPPRLLEASVSFSPPVDSATAKRWRATATWMAPHAKIFALYDRPFWREDGLSGTAQSMVGPLVEIHDATTASGAAALFGFVGVSVDQRAAIGEKALVRACVEQLGRLFGVEALRLRATLFKDWSADPLTATKDDRIVEGHSTPDRQPWVNGVWQGRILLAGSETSPSDPGYLAGAVDAGWRAVSEIKETSRLLAQKC